MELKCAKISNHARDVLNPENSMVEIKGQKGVCCLVNGINLPKTDGQAMPSKVTRIFIESFMKRPSVSNEAMDAIYKLANNGVLVTQSPQYPAFASASGIFMLKNKFVFASAGDNVIFHFVDGILKEVFSGANGADPVYLGNTRFSTPKVSDQMTFAKGENTFLMCSRKFAEAFSERDIEEALARATHVTQKGKERVTDVKCDRWLRELWDMLGNIDDREEYSAIAMSLPAKKKSKKALIIGIIIAVVVIAVAFLAVGFFTRGRGPQPPQEGAPGMTEPMFAPGESGFEPPTGPRGETAPAPPTRPAQTN